MNDILFKGYVPVTVDKKPLKPFKNLTSDQLDSFETIDQEPNYAGVLAPNTVLIDIDDYEQSEILMNIVEDLQLNCRVYQTTRGKHFYFLNNGDIKKCATHTKLACGLTADIKTGATNSLGILKTKGTKRDIIWGYEENATIDPLPKFLIPVKTNMEILQLKAGQGRNPFSYGYILALKNNKFSKEETKECIRIINKYIFSDPLPEQELEIILRDESFPQETVIDAPEINSAYDLMQMELKPIEFIVKDMLPVGLNLLASPPKFGKSWFALDLSLSVSSGTYFLGNETKVSTVYYLALEDSKNRLQSRIKKLLGNNNPSKNFYYGLEINTLDGGCIEQLEQVLKTLPTCKLIIIDTFQYIKGARGKTDGVYDYDYNTMKQLKKFADSHELSLLVIHHTRKDTNPYDAFANISGTNGITGACDTMMVFTKEERNSKQAKLSITGRDVDQQELMLTMTDCKWICEGNADEIKKRDDELTFRADPFYNTINSLLLDNNGKWNGTCQEILDSAEELGYPLLNAKGEPLSAISLGKSINKYDSKLTSIGGIKHLFVKSNGSGGAHHIYKFIEK